MATDQPSDRDLTPERLARLPEFHHPTVSPDGDRIAFYYDGTGRNELYVQNVASGERRRLTDGEVPRNARWHLEWDGTGDRVFFHRDEGGDEQNDLFAVDLDGEVEHVVEVDGQAVLWDVSDDGRHLLYGSDEYEQMNLYRFDTASGERERVTDYDQPVWFGHFDPNDERVAYTANESDRLENRDAYVANADGSEKRRLDVGVEGAETDPVDWHPDGDRLLLADNSEDLRRAGVYDLATDEVRWLGDGAFEEAAACFTPDGDRAVVVRHREAAAMPVVYDLETGEATALDLPEGVATVGGRSDFVGDDGLVLTHTTSDERQTLSRYDLATGERQTLVQPEYGDVDPEAFVEADYVTYESTDGLEIGALLYEAGDRPSPAVVMVHGGPHAQATRSFGLYAQFLCSEGYTVLKPNYRGSTGRGREFKQRILGDWGGMEQADVAAGGRWLKERAGVDEERVAVFGGSYGGYSTYCQLVQYPELWTTGVAWIGITDLRAMYEEAMPHYRAMLEQQLGDPEENEALWRERSPISHVDEVRVPLFIVHGVNDARCPVSQARRFRDALRERDWTEGEDGDFEYAELGEEGHGSTDIEQKVRAFDLVGDYLDRRL